MAGNTINHYLRKAARAHPDRTAVTDGKVSLTYAELDQLSRQLGELLLRAGIRTGYYVAVCMERSSMAVAAINGVLDSGAGYVPVDPASPVLRMKKIFYNCSPAAVICDRKTLEIVQTACEGIDPAPILVAMANRSTLPKNGVHLDHCLDDFVVCGDHVCAPDVKGSNVAYVIYTSGSTGTPKGVMVSHSNVRHYIDWFADYLELSYTDVILGTAPFHFDMSVFDIFAAQRSSSTLCLATDNLLLFPELLVRFMEQNGVTTWKGISSLLMYMCRAGSVVEGRMVSLRKVAFGGEHLSTRYLRQWMTALPNVEFFNAYGPTETTGVSVCHRVDQIPTTDRERVPIGRARAGTELLVIDDNDRRITGPGVGELLIGGPGVALGYLNDPLKTRLHFITDPETGRRFYRTGDLVSLREDGTLEFSGRHDGQVKVLGYRIEIGEIEDCLHSVEGVHDACVILVDNQEEESVEIAAFAEGHDELREEVLTAMENKLPVYMRPKHLHLLESLPRCNRGKVSREDLRQLLVDRKGRGG